MQDFKHAFLNFEITSEKSRLQIDRIHQFLSEKAYWCLGIPLATVQRAVEHSLCFGLIDTSTMLQIGFVRVVTDGATFAWICDVYVEDEYRGQNLSKWMLRCVLAHSDLQDLRRICLATRDAHTLYERFGFEATKNLGNWLEIVHDDMYRKT